MTNSANKKLLANCLVLRRQRPIAYLDETSPLKSVDVRWFAAPTYSQVMPSPPLVETVDFESLRTVKQKRRMSLSRGHSLRLKTLFASPAPQNRKVLTDISVHPLIPPKEVDVNEVIDVVKKKSQRTQVEGRYFDDRSMEDRFWLRNSTTHIYQQQSTANESWLARRFSITKRPLSSLSISRPHRQFSLKRALETVLN
ncbi:hypothetical protein Unana1_07187 [Umbelopsis nana]